MGTSCQDSQFSGLADHGYDVLNHVAVFPGVARSTNVTWYMGVAPLCTGVTSCTNVMLYMGVSL